MSTRFNISRSAAAAFGITALLAAAPAFSADVIGMEPPSPQPIQYDQVPVASWAGGYAGIMGGYSFGDTDINFPAGTNSIDTDGFNGSLFGGWNGQSGMFVYGLEGDVGYDWADGSNAGSSTERGFNGSLRARMGVAATDNILVYGTAGGAVARIEASDGIVSDSNTMYGWTAGVGADVKLTERVFARGEYRYTDYGSSDFALSGGATEVDAKSNNFLLGIGMKF